MKSLTTTQKLTLRWISQYVDENGRAPTQTEIADAFDVTQPTIHNRLRAMEKKGALQWERGEPRSIEIRGEADDQG